MIGLKHILVLVVSLLLKLLDLRPACRLEACFKLATNAPKVDLQVQSVQLQKKQLSLN